MRFGVVAIFVLMISSVCAASLNEVQDALDRRDYSAARVAAETILSDTESPDRARAAVLLLRSMSLGGDHAALVDKFSYCLEVAEGDDEAEAECYLERAKSVENNLRDKQQALALYQTLLEGYPHAILAAPAALYQVGGIELGMLELDKARSTYESVIRQHALSPFVDDSFAGLAQVEAEAVNPAGVDAAVSEIEKRFPGSAALQRAVLTKADFHNQVTGDENVARAAYEKLVQLAPQSRGAVTARVRLADLVFKKNFKLAIEQYQEILSEPGLSARVSEWINCQLGICHWQLDDPQTAIEYFQLVSRQEGSPNVAETARVHLAALENSESLDSMKALFDRGLRWRATGTHRDLCFRDFIKVLQLAGKPFYREYCSDSSVPIEERAQLKYKVALATFEVGDHSLIEGLATDILSMGSTGISRQQAQYLLAYHHGHCGHHLSESLKIYRTILEERPDHRELVPKVYMELAKAYERKNDPLGAVLTAEEFRILYPYRIEVQDMERLQRRIRIIAKEKVEVGFKKGREELLARLEGKQRPILLSNAGEQKAKKEVGPVSMAGGMAR